MRRNDSTSARHGCHSARLDRRGLGRDTVRMKHPFELLSPSAFRWLYWTLLAVTAGLAALLGSLGQVYSAKETADGRSFDVIDFELAHTPAAAREMMETWGEEGVRAARRQTVLDYPFLLCYSCLIALGIIAVLHNARGGVAALGRGLAWCQWIAALLDAVENAGLLIILSGRPETPWPQIAFYCAGLKFALITVGVLYILIALPLGRRKGGL